jgi:glucose/mannose-6-phosphate isomerase
MEVDMLDDLKYIHEKDAQDSLGIAAAQPQQLLHDFSIPSQDFKGISNVVYAAMGGSALAATILGSAPGFRVPFEITRQYNIPQYVSDKTLFIAASYSGNTEETIAALSEAAQKKARIVVVSGGGKLQEIAEKNNYLHILLPKAQQPRYAVFYNLKALLQLLGNTGLLHEEVSKVDLQKTANFLETESAKLIPTVPIAQNPAKQLARECMGKSIVVYSGPFMAPAAYKWKISFNENAKNVAWYGTLPEFSHNEFIGWSSHPTVKPYTIIDLETSYDHPQVTKRFDISARLLSGKMPQPHVVHASGESPLQHMLWTILMGDFVSIYLGLLNGQNPTPVALVEKMKKELV